MCPGQDRLGTHQLASLTTCHELEGKDEMFDNVVVFVSHQPGQKYPIMHAFQVEEAKVREHDNMQGILLH